MANELQQAVESFAREILAGPGLAERLAKMTNEERRASARACARAFGRLEARDAAAASRRRSRNA